MLTDYSTENGGRLILRQTDCAKQVAANGLLKTGASGYSWLPPPSGDLFVRSLKIDQNPARGLRAHRRYWHVGRKLQLRSEFC
jgi:hypothetical protein